MANAFKVGDAVHLKGGSPKMTVTRVEDNAEGGLVVHCAWFVGTEHKSAVFPTDAVPSLRALQAAERLGWHPTSIFKVRLLHNSGFSPDDAVWPRNKNASLIPCKRVPMTANWEFALPQPGTGASVPRQFAFSEAE